MEDGEFDLPGVGVSATLLPGSVIGYPDWTPFELPAVQVSGRAGAAEPALPAIEIAATLVSSPIFRDSDVILPAPTVSATALAGSLASAAFNLPGLAVAANSGAKAEIELPAPTIASTIVSGTIASAAVTLPAVSLAAEVGRRAGEATFDLPAPTIAATVISGANASAALTLPAPALTGTLLGGGGASAAFDLPAIDVDADLFSTAIITAVITLPVVTLDALLRGPAFVESVAAIASAPDSAVVMNLRTANVTTYRKFAFNSFATLANGRVLGCKKGGLYALEGTTDATAAIEWIITLPISDMGKSAIKRVTQAFVCYRSSGPMELRVKADDNEWYHYLLEETRPSGLYRNRVKLGRGLRAGQLQFELGGDADFELDSLELDVESLARLL